MKDIIYDVFGQRTKLSPGNGVVNEYTYDEYTRRLSHLKSFNGDKVFQNISYKFDAVGNILERVNKDFVTSGSVKKTSKQTYEYDKLYRLTASEGEYTKESWLPYFSDRTNIYTSSTSYNRVGNITHKMVDNRGIYPELGNDMRTLKDTTYDREYTYGGAQPHAVTRAGDLVMGYDDNGNMTSKEWTKYGVKMSMTWNSENRMTESVSQNVYSGAKTLTRYKYDYEGNRVVKSSNYGEVVTPSAEISYRNDSIVTKHIFVSGVRVASKVCDEKSSNTYYQSVDHLGSTNILTDAKGEFYEHIETFPDGNIWVKEYVNQSGVTTIFTSYTKDLETMLFVAGKRYYDAGLGVFVSVDPALVKYLPHAPNDRKSIEYNKKLPAGGIYEPFNLNQYSYCGNNPVNYIDPTGEFRFGKRGLNHMNLLSGIGNLVYYGAGGVAGFGIATAIFAVSGPVGWVAGLLSAVVTVFIQDATNSGVYHEHGFWDDGSGFNNGFGKDNGLFYESNGSSGYILEDKVYDDKIMNEVYNNLRRSGKYDANDYKLLGNGKNNCQDFADAMREGYKKKYDSLSSSEKAKVDARVKSLEAKINNSKRSTP